MNNLINYISTNVDSLCNLCYNANELKTQGDIEIIVETLLQIFG